MKNKKRIIFGFVFLLIFIFLLMLVLLNNKIFFDEGLMNFAYELRNDKLSSVFKIITFLGDSKFIIVLTILISLFLLIYKKDVIKSGLVFGNTFMVGAINQVIKHIIRRDRPVNIIIEEDGYSFPSGHSMMSMCFYGLLIYFIWKSNIKKGIKVFLTVILSLLIILIGFTRIYFGAHYPSDILAGYSITISFMILFIPSCIMILNKIVKKAS